MDHTILITFLKRRYHLGSLLLDFSYVAYVLHYYMSQMHPKKKLQPNQLKIKVNLKTLSEN